MAIEKPDPKKDAEETQAPSAEVLPSDVLEILTNVKPDQLVTPVPDSEVVKGRAYRSAAWLYGPAMLELMAMADRRLTKVAGLEGSSARRVERVKAMLIKGTKLLVVKAAPADDLTALPVTRYTGGSSAWINLISLLGTAGLTVESNWKELYEVAFVPKSSPLWPGLLINLGERKDRRSTAKKEGE